MTASNSMSTEVLDKIHAMGGLAIKEVERPDGGKELVVPKDFQTHTIPPLEPRLPRIRQRVTFYDIGSFIEYVNLFKAEGSRIFAVPGHLSGGAGASFKAILDYHQKAAADHSAHVALFVPKYSEPWVRWMAAAKQGPMLQETFGDFIEENAPDIVDPSAAELLDMVNRFRASKKVEFNSVVRQANGDVTIGYAEQTEVQGSRAGVTVPTELKLGIPVFFRGGAYEVRMFLRYKVQEKLTFSIKADRPEYIEQDAFDGLSAMIGDQTEIRPYLGVAA
jgi:uncharacterized protein YfdQ (DUF2303 family)